MLRICTCVVLLMRAEDNIYLAILAVENKKEVFTLSGNESLKLLKISLHIF